MKLVIGGYSQGKLSYILQNNDTNNYVIFDGVLPEENILQEINMQEKTIIINHFHNWVRNCMIQHENPEKEILTFISKNPTSIIISDEIGNGIVPIDVFERDYREGMGRILVELASMANEVVRVICGNGQKIK